jgi:hypothetical protein
MIGRMAEIAVGVAEDPVVAGEIADAVGAAVVADVTAVVADVIAVDAEARAAGIGTNFLAADYADFHGQSRKATMRIVAFLYCRDALIGTVISKDQNL